MPWIELNDEDLQVQFSIFDNGVGITMPYFSDRAREMMECVTDSFAPLKSAAGYCAYDPQLGRAVTAKDLDDILSQYQAVPQLIAVKKPWWKFW